MSSTRASSRGSRTNTGWWKRPATLLAVMALALGGGIVGQAATAPTASAASVQGSLDTGGWKYPIAGTGANATPTPIRIGASTSSSSDPMPFPVNADTLYWSNTSRAGTFATDGIPPTTDANQTLIGYQAGGGGVSPNSLGTAMLSTFAVDADPYGVRGHKYAYLWAWNSSNSVSTAQNGGVSVPKDTFPILRWEDGSTDGQFLLVPNVSYFPSQNSSNPYQYWSGGEVSQFTGDIYFGGAECNTLNTTYNMMIYNPYTYQYNFSGKILPATPADNIFGTSTTACDATGYVASDMALDANGNAYLLVNSNQAVPSFGVSSGSITRWLVRVVPGTNGASWTYSLVMPLAAAPGQSSQVNTFLRNGTSYGMAFFQGMLYVARNPYLMQVNPMSGLVYNLPNGSASPPSAGPISSSIYDLASGQGAMVIEGTVYQDTNGNGRIDSGESGLPGQTVALYMQGPDGTWIYEGNRTTNGSGAYSFLVGGHGKYIVRLVQPSVNGGTAWQTYASGSNTRNPVVAVCDGGNITSGDGVCNGALAYPANDPALPAGDAAKGSDTSTQPSAMPMYSTVTITTDEEVAAADFGVTQVPNPTGSQLAIDKDTTKVGTPITATATVVDSANHPIPGTVVSFANQSTDTSLSAATCVTGDGTSGTVLGQCSVTITSTTAATYPDELSASVKVGGQAVPISGSPRTVTFIPDDPTIGPFECKAGQQSTNIQVDPTSVSVGSQADVSVLVTDKYCNPLPGQAVTLSQVVTGTTSPSTTASFDAISGTPAGTTGDDGRVTATVTDSAQETIGVSATITAGLVPNSPVPVTFQLGDIDYTNSSFTVTPVADTADQSTWVTVGNSYTGTLTAKDKNNNALPGLNTSLIDFFSSSTDVKVSAVANNHDGTYTATFTSTVASATPTAAVKYDDQPVGAAKPIPFKVGDPQEGPWTCDDGAKGTGVYADAETASIDGTVGVYGLVTDKYCNPIPGVPVSLSTNSATATLKPVSGATAPAIAGTTDANGKVTATLADTKPEAVKVTGVMTVGTEIKAMGDATVTFTAGGPVPGPYSCDGGTVPGTGVYAGALSSSVDGTVEVWGLVTDAECNPLPGIPVGLAVTTGSATLSNVSGTLTGADGKVTATLADKTPEMTTVSGTMTNPYDPAAPADKQMGSVNVLFTPGTPVDGPYKCPDGKPGTGVYASAATSSVDDTVGVWGLVTDQYCNPLPGYSVTLAAGSATATLTPTSGSAASMITGVTGDDGKVSVTLADTKPEVVAVTGTYQDGATKPMGQVSVTFTAGDPVPGPYSCADGARGTGVYADPQFTSVDATSLITGLVTDQYCNPLPGVPVSLAVTNGHGVLGAPSGAVTNAAGQVTATLSDTAPEQVTVAGTMTTSFDPSAPTAKQMGDVVVTFSFGNPQPGPWSCDDPNNPGQTIRGTGVYADQSTSSVDNTVGITALVTDIECNPIPGVPVSLVLTGSSGDTAKLTNVSGEVTDDAGQVTAKLADTVPETVTTTGTMTVNSSVLPVGSADVTFTAGAPVEGPYSCGGKPGTGVYVDPSVVSIDHTSTVTGLVTDQYCNPLPNMSVTLTTDSVSASLKPAMGAASSSLTGTTGDDGKVVATLADTVPQVVKVSGTYQSTTAKTMGDASVTFTAGDPVPGPWSCIDPNDPNKTIPGTGVYTAAESSSVDNTVAVWGLVTDAQCNPLPGVPVGLAVTAGSGVLSDISGTVSGADGKVTATLADTVPETTTVSGSLTNPFDGTAVDKQMGSADVTFTAGAPVEGPYSCGGKPGTGVYAAATTSSVDLTVDVWGLVTDQYCNPLPGWAVVLATDSATATLTSPSGVTAGNVSVTTGADGKANATLASLKPGAVKVAGQYLQAGNPKAMGDVTVTFTTGDPVPGPFTCDDPENPGQTILGTSLTAVSPVGIAGSSTVTALVTDQYCNAISGVAVDLTVTSSTTANLAVNGTGVTGADGKVTAVLTDSVPETVTVVATMSNGPVGSADVVFQTAGTPHITSPGDGTKTNNPKPTIAGDGGEPGQTVTVTADNNGQQITVCQAVVKSDGTWSCTAEDGLPDGANDVTATQTSPLGRSGVSNHITVNVNTSVPPAPVITSPQDGDVTNNNQPTFTGENAEPGSTVEIKDGNGHVVCSVTIPDPSDGSWSCTPSAPLPDGEYSFTAEQTNDVGTSSGPSDPVHVHVKATPPVAPAITSPKDGDFTNDNQPTVAGTGAEPGATVTVKDGHGNVLCTVTVPATSKDGAWSCHLNAPLPDGDQTIVANQTDIAGNVGADSAPIRLHVKTTAPTDPVVDPTNGSEITGTTDPDTTVTVTDEDGNPVPGCQAIKPDSNGRFSCRPDTPIKPGTQITITATDKAGNQSNPVKVTVGALAIKIDKPVVKIGDVQTVTGYNFNPGERVHLELFSATLDGGYSTANADGTVAFVFAVPDLLQAGTHTARLTGDQSGAVSGTFEVTTVVHTGGLVAPPATSGLVASSMLAAAGLCWALLRRRVAGGLAR